MRNLLKISCVAIVVGAACLASSGSAEAAPRRSYRGYSYNPNAPVSGGYQGGLVVFAPFNFSLGPIPGYARADHKMTGKFGGR